MAIPVPPGCKTQPKDDNKVAASDFLKSHGIEKPKPMVEIKSTNRTLEISEETVEEIMRRVLKPIHGADPNIIRFIHNYLYCRDKKQAARMTGLNARDGHNLLERRDIYNCIQEVTAKAVQQNGYDADEVIAKVKEIAFVDPAELQKEDGSYIDKLSDAPAEVRRAIKRMKVKNIYEKDANGMLTGVIEGKIIEIEFWDKMKATELLGRDKGIFKEKKVVEHDVSSNMRDILLESRSRAQARIAGMRDVGPAVNSALVEADNGDAE